MNMTAYWEKHATYPQLECMPARCYDCAITTGFYRGYLDDLKKQPREIQEMCARTWFCHNNGNRSCKGVMDEIMGEVKEGEGTE